jgi:predicted membrane protein (TIGR00267 family)
MEEPHKLKTGEHLRNFILGAQDGIVNVLGLVLGVATATLNTNVIIISGLAGLFAESVSMGAVAFTSSSAERDFYKSQIRKEKREIKEIPKIERKEIEAIYKKKGFKGEELKKIVEKITSNKKIWLKTMMREELGLSEKNIGNPTGSLIWVLLATILGSIIPILPFFIFSVKEGIVASIILSSLALFLVGVIKGKCTLEDWRKTGIQLLIIGLTAAVLGYLFGLLLGHFFGVSATV